MDKIIKVLSKISTYIGWPAAIVACIFIYDRCNESSGLDVDIRISEYQTDPDIRKALEDLAAEHKKNAVNHNKEREEITNIAEDYLRENKASLNFQKNETTPEPNPNTTSKISKIEERLKKKITKIREKRTNSIGDEFYAEDMLRRVDRDPASFMLITIKNERETTLSGVQLIVPDGIRVYGRGQNIDKGTSFEKLERMTGGAVTLGEFPPKERRTLIAYSNARYSEFSDPEFNARHKDGVGAIEYEYSDRSPTRRFYKDILTFILTVTLGSIVFVVLINFIVRQIKKLKQPKPLRKDSESE